MVNPQTLREASFSLATIGCSPDAVDACLADLADHIEAGTVDWMIERTRLADCEYRVESPGYVEAEVRAFFAGVLDSVAAVDEQPASSTEDETEMSDEHIQPQVDEDAPAVVAAPVDEIAVSRDLGILTEAIQRAKRTVAGLEAFVESDVAAIEGSCERQLSECQAECDQALTNAQAKAAKCVTDAQAAARRVTSAAQREWDQARRQWETELQNLRQSTEHEIESHRVRADNEITEIHAAAERDRAEAREAVERAVDMQSSIAQSLEKARAELMPPPSTAKRAA